MAAIFKALITLIVLQNFGYQHSAEAKMLAMRPLSARQVYRLLHESGRTDAIPQGRVITQGLAAMTGFALGLTKGLGGALLFDIITANVTAADLEAAVNGGNAGSGSALTTQEICFNSRSARSLAEAEAVAEAYSRDGDKNKQHKPKVRLSEVERHVTRKRRDKRRKKSSKRRHKRPTRLVLAKQSTGTATGGGGDGGDGEATATGTAVATTNPQTTAATTATANPTVVGTGTDTNIDNGDGTGTSSTSTTSTGNGGAVNCIVIQKPAVG